ncbi:hypothetical protein OG455_14995 [Kitasatospora sp. NBC_01287]|uniref:LppU/SCO3897 family protein n=1 Tax=Kitasatospora sp. NBC_01287 TaxID=2903573 RepID=UPI00224E859A|nr:hypothetical protein [Kitasatospora sp. NBC_01287]MCX4746813.1 hypothetical protein [Kitasatospora sp. NBC_01287]
MTSPYPPPGPNPYANPNPYAAAPPQPYPQQPPQPYPQPQPHQAPGAYGQPTYGQPAAAPPYGAPPHGAPPHGAPPYAAPPYAAPAYGAPLPGQPAPAYPAPGFPPPAPDGTLTCRFCGGYPAVQTTVRGHRGMVVWMVFLRRSGPFCRTCGTAVVRHMSAQTIVRGWWSWASAVIAPLTLLWNVVAYRKIRKLPPSIPGGLGPQLDMGKPLVRRPAMLMLLVPLAAILLVIAGAVAGGGSDTDDSSFPTTTPTRLAPEVATGDCVHNAGTDDSPAISVVPCSDPSAQFTVLARVDGTTDADTACAKYPSSDNQLTHTEPGDNYVLCMLSKATKAPAAS